MVYENPKANFYNKFLHPNPERDNTISCCLFLILFKKQKAMNNNVPFHTQLQHNTSTTTLRVYTNLIQFLLLIYVLWQFFSIFILKCLYVHNYCISCRKAQRTEHICMELKIGFEHYFVVCIGR